MRSIHVVLKRAYSIASSEGRKRTVAASSLGKTLDDALGLQLVELSPSKGPASQHR
jgi:hypothetical protein